jgi:hypothetical protein
MKWIKTRQQWLNEGKVRDEIFPRQAKEIASYWGEKFLDYETVKPTDKIVPGNWKLEEEDKLKALSAFFDCDMKVVTNLFSNIPDKFNYVLIESIKPELLDESAKIVLHELNIQAPTVDQMVFIFDNVFRKLDINSTRASEMIQKDENGVPVRDEEGNMVRIKKNEGDPIFTNNLVNINTFVDDYNRCYSNEKVEVNFQNRDLSQLRNLAKENHNRDYNFEFSIFGKDLYLQIDHNPKDILNMSISKFYASCQHLYSGGYRSQLLGNIFDANSIPAFLYFDSPIIWKDEKISDKLPLSRMMIRNIEDFDTPVEDQEKKEPKIFFDRAYPDRMKNVFDELVENYSENKQTISDSDGTTYTFMPDIDCDDSIDSPYMDRLRLKQRKMIGKNTKRLYLSMAYDWSKTIISQDAEIKELIIETPDIPQNLLDINLKLEWIQFQNIKIKTLTGFENVKTDSLSFDHCKFDTSIFEEINSINPNIKKLKMVSCEINGNIDFSKFNNLEELQILFNDLDLEEIEASISNLKIKKLVISGDNVSGPEGKRFLSDIRRKGIKVETVGPVI